MTKSSRSFEQAVSVCKTLFNAGYIAFFAGGWVRDLLLNIPSDEIDIATNAPPYVIQKLFPKTIPVGIAFGVVIVVIGDTHFEVTTFRKDHPYLDGRHPEGIDFSTPEKDAQRRDFTINGMFYDPLTDTLFDYVGGQKDLEEGIIRAIGQPDARFEEDRLRMIRAVRFAARFQFKIEGATESAIKRHAHSLFPSVSIERVWQEFNKMRPLGPSLALLHQLRLLPVIFPVLENLSFNELEKRISPFSFFPDGCPTILFLMELFPTLSLEEKMGICRYLKTSAKDAKLVEFREKALELLNREQAEPVEWAKFYAHPHHDWMLDIESAKKEEKERFAFIKMHEERKKTLKIHIARMKSNRPLVDAAFLQSKGIKPGKILGELLREAERIAVNQDLRDPEAVFSILKNKGP